MLGVPLADKSHVYGDNLSVIVNCSRPDSVLKKKTHACYFHFIRELCVASLRSLHHIPSTRNRADALTKSLPGDVFFNLIKTVLLIKDDVEHEEEPKQKSAKVSPASTPRNV